MFEKYRYRELLAVAEEVKDNPDKLGTSFIDEERRLRIEREIQEITGELKDDSLVFERVGKDIELIAKKNEQINSMLERIDEKRYEAYKLIGEILKKHGFVSEEDAEKINNARKLLKNAMSHEERIASALEFGLNKNIKYLEQAIHILKRKYKPKKAFIQSIKAIIDFYKEVLKFLKQYDKRALHEMHFIDMSPVNWRIYAKKYVLLMKLIAKEKKSIAELGKELASGKTGLAIKHFHKGINECQTLAEKLKTITNAGQLSDFLHQETAGGLNIMYGLVIALFAVGSVIMANPAYGGSLNIVTVGSSAATFLFLFIYLGISIQSFFEEIKRWAIVSQNKCSYQEGNVLLDMAKEIEEKRD